MRTVEQLMEQGWVYRTAQLFTIWDIQAAVLSSFAAHLVLVILAGARRRKASGVRMLLLWLAYQLGNFVAPYALTNLSLCDPSPRQQLIAFWAPFLLHHLAGPDNISALSLEDNALSGREVLTVASRIGGATYVLYKHVYIGGGGGGALIPASIIIFAVGATKYAERAFALWRGDLANIRSSSKKKGQLSRFITTCSGTLAIRSTGWERCLDDEDALMVAHAMLPLCRRAMADSSVPADGDTLHASREIFGTSWDDTCKVVEMELSLMYDILYTKEAVVHTWHGYGIRVISPAAIAATTVLFGFYYSKEGQSKPDVMITYVLLAATFLLDTSWLLRALGSTWMHGFLQCSWLHHAILCTGRWRRLGRVIVSLDLGRLRLTATPRSPSSYRRWSGKVGQYSLLREVTREMSLCGKAAKKIGLENVWKEYQHSNTHKLSHEVKEAIFTRVTKVLRLTYQEANKHKNVGYSMTNITTNWGQVTAKRFASKSEEKTVHLAFGREFQEDILVWHIATQVFLMCGSLLHGKHSGAHANAIKALSDYLMFLVAVRRHMLPGLKLRSLYERTFESLQRVWSKDRGKAGSCCSTTEEEQLARILRHKKDDADRGWGMKDAEISIISDGANLAIELLEAGAEEFQMPLLLELVFNVWVDKLLHAATLCSPESHAMQLSRGGELTTIVWIMVQHAGPFTIGEKGPDDDDEEPTDDETQQVKHGDKVGEEKKATDGKRGRDKEPLSDPYPGYPAEPPKPKWASEPPPPKPKSASDPPPPKPSLAELKPESAPPPGAAPPPPKTDVGEPIAVQTRAPKRRRERRRSYQDVDIHQRGSSVEH
nr:uncharacterized protein LOC109747038 isoform X2 [Aegilops tauschii subsp. strangulata]